MTDTIATGLGPLTVHPVEHASLVLSAGRHVIYADPCWGLARYAGLPRPTGILVTHQHDDHLDLETLVPLAGESVPLVVSPLVAKALPKALAARATVLANGESGTLDGLAVRAIPAYNTSPERLKYHPRGMGNGYLVDFGGTTVYIAGDGEDTPEMRALRDIALAFLPMNLPYTMVAEQAADAVRAFRPRVVYPFHYTRNNFPQAFARLVADTDTEVRLRDWYPARG